MVLLSSSWPQAAPVARHTPPQLVYPAAQLAGRIVGLADEGFSVRGRIGVRNARRVLGDAAIVDETHDVFDILAPRRPQEQSDDG